MKKSLLIITILIASALLTLVAVASFGHLFVPVYDFVGMKPFSGDSLYNPYAGVDFKEAKKAVFHIHTTRSDGKDDPEAIVGAYRHMGYDIVSVADHDRVTPAGIAPERELRTYEHGLNISRSHSVVFGAREPLCFQLPLRQGVSGREETLRRLRERYFPVVLNHPAGVRGLTVEQMERLSHYDYLEADRSMDRDFPLWDAALSFGHYSYIMANDDLHDLSRRYAIGRAMTFIMTPGVDSAAVMKALASGHTYAVRVAEPSQKPDSVCLPGVERFDLSGDTLRVAFTDSARVRFVGQGGDVRAEVFSDEASYLFESRDTYIRVEARFRKPREPDSGFGPASGGMAIYLNPVARYSPTAGERPLNASYSVRNLPLTVLSVLGHALLILACVAGICLLFFRKRKTRRVK